MKFGVKTLFPIVLGASLGMLATPFENATKGTDLGENERVNQ